MLTTAPQSGFLAQGHPAAEALVRALSAGSHRPRSLLIHGPSGAGKGAFATDIVAFLACQAADGLPRPCNACAGCRGARSGAHPDLVVGSPEAWRDMRGSGESAVAAARRWLSEAAGAPVLAPYRIIRIDHLDRASEDIQNVLLKALEEPTSRHVFLVVADDLALILPTIRSRLATIRIGPAPTDTLVATLMDLDRLPHEQAVALARLSGGLVGRARQFAREPQYLDWRRRTQAELLALLDHGWADRFAAVRELLDGALRLTPRDAAVESEGDETVRTPSAAQRAAALAIIEVWIDLGRDLLVTASGRGDLAASQELFVDLAQTSRRLDATALAASVAELNRVRDALEQNASARLALEAAMLAWPRVAA